MTFTHELITDKTITLNPSDEFYVKMNGIPGTTVISVHFPSSPGSLVVESSIESFDYFLNTATQYSDCLWESIKINNSYTNPVTTDILSLAFHTPNIIHLKNTHVSAVARVSLRGNR